MGRSFWDVIKDFTNGETSIRLLLKTFCVILCLSLNIANS